MISLPIFCLASEAIQTARTEVEVKVINFLPTDNLILPKTGECSNSLIICIGILILVLLVLVFVYLKIR
ncbi:LPXTG cell wall anchor domain-containing protein [Enterococcus hirae]|nr:LPXTG cell wall anchor domain-containing protein [Enterococcus hirae]